MLLYACGGGGIIVTVSNNCLDHSHETVRERDIKPLFNFSTAGLKLEVSMGSQRTEGFLSLYVSESGDYISMLPASKEKSEIAILSMLYKYPDLEEIRLQDAKLTPKIESKLTRMPKLTKLILQNTSYSSLSFLRDAKHLTDLTLHWVHSLKGLGDVSQLKSLTVDSNTLTDLSILEPLQELEELVFTRGDGGDWPADSEVEDVRPLKHLAKLRSLFLGFAGKDLSGFAELKQLRVLGLSMERSDTDISPLAHLTQLEGLGLSRVYYDPITDITPIGGLTNLKFLRIHRQKLKSLEPVRNMTKLIKLDCAGNHIRTLKPLEHLVSLKELHAQNNAIRDIKPLRNLKNMAVLNIGGTKVQDISPLSGMKNLSWLCLNGKIADLTPLSSLKSLQALYLNGYDSIIKLETQEIDLGPVLGLEKLTTIDINHCTIKNLESIREDFDLINAELQRKNPEKKDISQ